MQELSNRKLLGLLSVESSIALIITLVSVGVAWQVLASDVETQKRDISLLKTQQKAVVRDLGSMKVDLVKISTQQDAQADFIADLKSDIKYIRELLEQRYRQ